jgi:radical SAM protein with 4Fe4S-binding SPASM domain
MDAPFMPDVFSIARLYETAQRMYSAVPFHFFRNGYAFPPWHFYVEITRRCNLRCRMCQYIGWLEHCPPEEKKAGELTTEEWRGVIDQFPHWSLATFTGGEPFVREDFLDLLDYASARLRTHFISNATLIDEARAAAAVRLAPKRLGGRGLNFAGVSVEGPEEVHDEIRQLAGGWQRTMRGVRLLRELRDKAGKQCPAIHVTTVLQDAAMDRLHELPALLRAAGADVWNLVTETRMHDLPDLGEKDPSMYDPSEVTWPHIDRAKLAAALDRAVAAAADAGIELRLPRMPREELLNYYDGTGVAWKSYECRNAWNTLIIARNGDVYPCWILRAGNVRADRIRDIWNREKMRFFRKDCQHKIFAMCPGCCFLEHKSRKDAFRYLDPDKKG